MTFKFRFADRIVGIFILIAMIFVLFMLIVAGVNRQWFAHQYEYRTRFNSAEGLSVGAAIKFKGVEVGEMKSFRLNKENLVDAEFVIYEAYIDKLKPDSILELVSNPLGIGGGGLKLHPGNNSLPPPAEGSYIPSSGFPEALELMEEGRVSLDRKGDVISDLMATVPELLAHVDETVLTVNDLLETVDLSLEGDRSAGPVGNILWEAEDLMSRTDALVAHLSSLLYEIEHADELVPTLLGQEGVAGGLISDDAAFYGEITGLTDELLVSLSNLGQLTGSLNSLSPQIDLLLIKLGSTLDNAEDVLEGLTNNPLLRGGIEETRELPSAGGSTTRDEEF